MLKIHPRGFRIAGRFLLFVFLSIPIAATAVDQNGLHVFRGTGAGDGTCGTYVREDRSYKFWFEHWLMGYVSGVNSGKRGKADFSNGVAAQGLLQWVEKYCKENPLSSFGNAADAMLDEINSTR